MSVPPIAANPTSSPPSLSSPTTDPSLLLSLATDHLDRGDPTTACDILRRLVQLQPESGQAWVSLARAYYLKGDFETSFATYQRALSSKKEGNCEAQLWYGVGLLSSKVKDYTNAISTLKMVFTVDPLFKEGGEVWLKLGEIYREIENWPEAVKALKQSVISLKAARLAKAFCVLGLCHEELGEGEIAINCYRKAVESDPNEVRPLTMLGWALRMNKEPSLSALQQVLSVSQGNSKEEALIHYLIGRVSHLHSLPLASRELEIALELDPSNPLYLTSMAVVQYEGKNWTVCEAYLRQVIDLLPDQSLPVYDLGVLLEARGRKAEAVQAYEKAILLDKGRFQAPKARLGNIDRKDIPEMLHPAFDIEENGAVMQVRAVEIRPIAATKAAKARAPVFKVTRAAPAMPKPIPTGKKRGKLDHTQGSNPRGNMEMYPMMPFFCMPPGAEMPKGNPNGFPGYFPGGQMMYYPYMMPYYMPQSEAGPPPPQIVPQVQNPPAKTVPELPPSSPSSTYSDTARPPVDLDDLISSSDKGVNSSDQDSDASDEGGSIDGIHIGGKRRGLQKPTE